MISIFFTKHVVVLKIVSKTCFYRDLENIISKVSLNTPAAQDEILKYSFLVFFSLFFFFFFFFLENKVVFQVMFSPKKIIEKKKRKSATSSLGAFLCCLYPLINLVMKSHVMYH